MGEQKILEEELDPDYEPTEAGAVFLGMVLVCNMLLENSRTDSAELCRGAGVC